MPLFYRHIVGISYQLALFRWGGKTVLLGSPL